MAKILLCEDSAFFAQAIQVTLKTQGYEVVHAADGQIGLEKLKEAHDFDLILCDIMMPNLDGFGVLKAIKEDASLSNIPFIFLTGVSDLSSMERGTQLGAKDYFIKSNVSMDKLIELVKKYI
ncbi:response regulator [Candidatus Beckwithbacteria bacterium]|nr:response regulator [Candidatus Beckwithbacteria bacterium]